MCGYADYLDFQELATGQDQHHQASSPGRIGMATCDNEGKRHPKDDKEGEEEQIPDDRNEGEIPFRAGGWLIDKNDPGRPGQYTGRFSHAGNNIMLEGPAS